MTTISRKMGKAVCKILFSVVSGLLIALALFLLGERVFPLPDIAGRWCVETYTTHTQKTGYQNMVIQYMAILLREGPIVKGTMEKLSENAPNSTNPGLRKYNPADRVHGTIEGSIQKLYTGSKDLVVIHIIEEGEKRVSTQFHNLTVEHSDTLLIGEFFSTAANSEGKAIWRRTMQWEENCSDSSFYDLSHL